MISVCWIVISAGLVLVFRYCSYVREDELVLVGRQFELRSSLRQSSVEFLNRFAICCKQMSEIDES